MPNLVATAETDIDAPPEQVWAALVDPSKIREYMFGSEVHTDWRPGSPIVWKGEYEGKSYEDKGTIVENTPQHRLQMTHYSPLSGAKDAPENYHTLTYEMTMRGAQTHLSLSQDNNASEDEVEHSKQMWGSMLKDLKKVAEAS